MKRLIIISLTLLLSAFIPILAIAQTTNSINYNPVPTDVTYIILQAFYGYVDNVLYGNGSQLFGTLFGVVNGGILVVAGCIVTYTLLLSTIKTAHEGEVLGKEFKTLWLPLRTVGGLALLIPKASGYSYIQIFMMWVVLQGIGLADSIWGAAIDYYTGGGVNIQQISSPNNFNAGSSTSGPVSNASDILRSLTCMYMIQDEMLLYNQEALTTQPPLVLPAVPNFYNSITQQFSSISSTAGGGTINFPGSLAQYGSHYAMIQGGECGNLNWTQVSLPGWMYTGGSTNGTLQPQYAGLPTQIAITQFTAVQSLIVNLAGPAQTIANNYVIYNGQSNGTATALGALRGNNWVNPVNSALQPLMNANVIMNPSSGYIAQFKTLMDQLSLSQSSTNFNTQLANSLKAGGWGLAGAALGTLMTQSNSAASLNTSVAQILTMPPQTGLNTNQDLVGFFGNAEAQNGATFLNNIENAVNGSGNDFAVGPGSPFIQGAGSYSGTFSNNVSTTANGGSGSCGSDPLNCALQALFNPLGGISQAIDGMENAQNNNANPILLASSLGNSIVNFFLDFWIYGTIIIFAATIALAVVPSVNMSNVINTPLQWIMSFITPFMVILITCGLTLTYYLPLIPYIIFTFGVIGWFVNVLEAMIAAPLVAIGIAHPEGAHAILGKADPAVDLLVHVFLRPTLMIIGLLAGISMAYVGIWLINYGFGEAWSYASANASGFASILIPAVSKTVIYTVMCVTVMQLSFTLIYRIPDGVFKWAGMKSAGLGFEEAEGKVAGGYGKFTGGAGEMVGGEQGKVAGTLAASDQLAASKGGGGGMDSGGGGGGGGGNDMTGGGGGGADAGAMM